MLELPTTVAASPVSVASATKEAGNCKVTAYGDGALTSDQDTGLVYMSDAGLKKDLTNAQPNAGVAVQPTGKTSATASKPCSASLALQADSKDSM